MVVFFNPAIATQLQWPDKRPVVVIDPGHGGADSGLSGLMGKLEKKAALDFSKTLAEVFKSKFKVVLTRDDDYNVDSDQRAGIANRKGGRVFFSIHAGTGKYPNRDSITIFVIKPDSFRQGGLCRRADSPALALWHRNQLKYLTASLRLAETLASEFERSLPESIKISIRQAPVLVLRGVKAPAVLVEIGFLLNGRKDKDLDNAALEHKLVQAWFEAVKIFLKHP